MLPLPFSWSTQALVLPRLAKSERSGYWATALSYGVVAPFFVATGGVMALAMFVKTGVYESDPTTMLSTLKHTCLCPFKFTTSSLCQYWNPRDRIIRELYDCKKRDAQSKL